LTTARGAEPHECFGDIAGRKNATGDGGSSGGYPNVALLDATTKKLTWVTDLKWEAEAGEFSPMEVVHVFGERRRADGCVPCGYRHAERRKIEFAGRVEWIFGESEHVFGRWETDAGESSKLDAAGDLWIYDAGAKSATQLTFSAIAAWGRRNYRLRKWCTTRASTEDYQRIPVGALQLEADGTNRELCCRTAGRRTDGGLV